MVCTTHSKTVNNEDLRLKQKTVKIKTEDFDAFMTPE